MNLDDDDAVGSEGERGLVGADGAGGFFVSLEVAAAIGTVEELLLERTFDGVSTDAQLDGGSGRREDDQDERQERQERAKMPFGDSN